MGIGHQSSNFNKKWSRNITCSPCVNIEMNHTDLKSKNFKDNDWVIIYPSYRYKVECRIWLKNQYGSSSLILSLMCQTFCHAKDSDTEWEKLFLIPTVSIKCTSFTPQFHPWPNELDI